jgi:hypothetical protein
MAYEEDMNGCMNLMLLLRALRSSHGSMRCTTVRYFNAGFFTWSRMFLGEIEKHTIDLRVRIPPTAPLHTLLTPARGLPLYSTSSARSSFGCVALPRLLLFLARGHAVLSPSRSFHRALPRRVVLSAVANAIRRQRREPIVPSRSCHRG